MILVQPTIFNKIDKRHKYVVNFQFLRSFQGPAQLLSLRLGCTLKATSTTTNIIPGSSYIEFICVCPNHRDRFCSNKNNTLKLTQATFEANKTSLGNVLVKLNTSRCHQCGETSTKCWKEFTNHLVCMSCVKRGNTAEPYPYGDVLNSRCEEFGCGKALKWFSYTDQELITAAIDSYERHST